MSEMLLTRKDLDLLDTDALINQCYQQLNLNTVDSNALKFSNAFIQLTEEQLTRQLIEVIVKKGFSIVSKKPEILEALLRDANWTSKINVIENIDDKRYKPMVVFSRKMNALRNQIFHAKFSSLEYDGKKISDVNTQRDMFFDYVTALHDCVIYPTNK